MERGEIPRDTVTFSTLITGLGNAGRIDEALELFEEMKRGEISRNTVTFSTLITGLGNAERIDAALKLFEEMKMEEIPRNTVTFNTLITGLGKAGRIDAALKLFVEMKREHIPRNTVTFNTLMNIKQLKRENPDFVLTLFDQMVNDSIQISGFTYVAVMSACEQAFKKTRRGENNQYVTKCVAYFEDMLKCSCCWIWHARRCRLLEGQELVGCHVGPQRLHSHGQGNHCQAKEHVRYLSNHHWSYRGDAMLCPR